jgi:uncharacterized protein (TIRG00374 family)
MTPTRWFLTALSFALAIGASVYIIGSSWSVEGARVSLPLWAHAACLAAAVTELLTRATKIRLSGAALRIPLTLRTAIRVSLGGDFGGSITPSRSGGEPARFLILREAGMKPANSLIILFTELFLEMLSLASVAVILAIGLRGSSGQVKGLIGMVAIYSTAVLGAGLIGFLLSRHSSTGPPPAWARWLRLHAGRWRAIQRALRQLRGSIDAVRKARWSIMALSLLFSIIHVLMRLSVLPIIVYSLGVRVPIGPLVLWPLAILYGGAAAPAPGGGGVIEIAFRAALGGDIPPQVMGTALLWWRFYTFYVLLIAGAIVAGGVVMRALKKDDEEELAEAAR